MPPDRRVRRVLEMLTAEWNREVCLSELPARVGLGLSRLEALFKAEAQMSMREYLLTIRLERAAKLVAATDERISQIAYGAGFRDISNFNHAFKKRFGVSPRAYRLEQLTSGGSSICDSYQENGKSPN